MQFTPKTEEQVSRLLAEGLYQYEVIKAVEKVSKNGNPMIELLLKIFDDESGRTSLVTDYLMVHPDMEHKIRHFCYSNDLVSNYEKGRLDDVMCVGQVGKCRIRIRKDKEGKYPDKNVIADYVMNEETAQHIYNKAVHGQTMSDDEIPF